MLRKSLVPSRPSGSYRIHLQKRQRRLSKIEKLATKSPEALAPMFPSVTGAIFGFTTIMKRESSVMTIS